VEALAVEPSHFSTGSDATANTPDCELMPSVYTTAVGLNDRADIMHVFTAYCCVLSCLACQC